MADGEAQEIITQEDCKELERLARKVARWLRRSSEANYKAYDFETASLQRRDAIDLHRAAALASVLARDDSWEFVNLRKVVVSLEVEQVEQEHRRSGSSEHRTVQQKD